MLLTTLLCGCLREHSTDIATFDSVATFDESNVVATVEEPSTTVVAATTAPKKKTQPATTVQPTTAATTTETAGVYHEPVDSSFFDDAVFLGDSLTVALENYCSGDYSALGNAKFFCAGGLGYTNIMVSGRTATYNGAEYAPETCGQVTGANKIFICLGMNDLASGVDATLNYAYDFMDRLVGASPNAHIYMQAVTPMLAGYDNGLLNNTTIKSFNLTIKEYCELNGFTFIDINTPLLDSTGCLAYENCGDPDGQGLHLSFSAYPIWINTLKCYV